MNVQEQEDSYSCGDLAVAFATSLIHGEDPTQLHYKQLRNHLKDCVDKFGIVGSGACFISGFLIPNCT